MEKLCDRLNRALRESGLRQTELCQLTGIPKSAMSQYFSGRIKPKQDRINALASALSVDPGWLLGFDSYELNERERHIIRCYRQNEAFREQLDSLLNETVKVFRAAKSKDNSIMPSGELMARDRLERLKNAPETDEDL